MIAAGLLHRVTCYDSQTVVCARHDMYMWCMGGV